MSFLIKFFVVITVLCVFWYFVNKLYQEIKKTEVRQKLRTQEELKELAELAEHINNEEMQKRRQLIDDKLKGH